jgi:hypothetical protein
VHLLQYLYVRISYILYIGILLCSVRCNFIEKRFNRIKKPINSAEAAVVVIRVNVPPDALVRGIFFFFFFAFLSHAHSNSGRDTTEAVKTENYRARSHSLTPSPFFNRSLITTTWYLYRYIHYIVYTHALSHTHMYFLYTYILSIHILYYCKYSSSSRVYIRYNSSHIL